MAECFFLELKQMNGFGILAIQHPGTHPNTSHSHKYRLFEYK